MAPPLCTGVWRVLLQLLEEYSIKYSPAYSEYDGLQVYTGPIYDYNSDGLADGEDDIPE